METTKFVSNQGKSYINYEKCHDGEGAIQFLDVIKDVDRKLFIKGIHDDIIPPGTSIGHHQHKYYLVEEEWYFCLEGEGIMTLDGKDYPMKPGDISVCYANGFHGLKNTGSKNMRIIVIDASQFPAEGGN